MSKPKFNSRLLRQLAEDVVGELAADGAIPEEARDDLATSLVRQWITYGGNAALFLEAEQVYLALGQTPLGRPCVIPKPALPGWINQLTRDWKVRPDDLPDILGELNRGQSAEVINAEGEPLRLWVNPGEGRQGVESLVKQPRPPGAKRDYHKIAAGLLERHLGAVLEEDEMEALACSVAAQWQRYGGHACLFFAGGKQLVFTLTELEGGNCNVAVGRQGSRLEPVLCSAGIPPEVVPEAVAQINLGQEVEFRDRDGVRSGLRYDPRAREVQVRRLDGVRPGVRGREPPIFCSTCNAVLQPWPEGEREQRCRHCGQTIALPE